MSSPLRGSFLRGCKAVRTLARRTKAEKIAIEFTFRLHLRPRMQPNSRDKAFHGLDVSSVMASIGGECPSARPMLGLLLETCEGRCREPNRRFEVDAPVRNESGPKRSEALIGSLRHDIAAHQGRLPPMRLLTALLTANQSLTS